MAQLKTLRASTMIEAVVAAVIFLIVFSASLDIITRISVNHKDDDYILVEVDNCVDLAMTMYSSGIYEVGTYTGDFSWGKIITTIERYKDDDSILQLIVRAEIENSYKQISNRRLIEIPNKL